MLEASVRNILFFDTILKPHHEGIKDIPLDGILRSLEDENRKESFVKLIDNEQAAVRLSDINVDFQTNTATLLITYADKRGADPVFANLEKGTLRSEPKLDGEGVAISAHLMFGLKPNAINGLYPAILEDVPGIGRTLLEPFLRSAFKNASSYKFQNQNKNEQKTWPVPTLVVKQSEQLSKSLSSGGYLTEVEVTKYAATGGFDQIEGLQEKKTTTVIKIDGRPTGTMATDLLNKIKIFANNKKYYDMRVRWVNANKQTKTVALGTARADVGDVLFGRVERIGVNTPLPQCSEKIQSELLSAMLKYIK
ncbi:exported phage protein [Agrobacterium tumefaciens str. Cherry 2E-2-2]|nr:exported phage protein [Agrobacterium tumefaciens str. Cherry 2E-2-2]